MSTDFVKKNWIYIVLFCIIVTLNVLPHFEKKEEVEEGLKTEERQSLFVDFEEAQRRSQKIENTLKGNLPLYLFYISLNLLVVFLFLLGLALDGYFLFTKFKNKNIFQRTHAESAPRWKISDVLKIIILGFTFTYIFLIIFGSFLPANENFRMIFDTIILDFIVLLVILKFARNIYKKRLADLGFAKKNMAKNILYGISGYIGILPVIFIIGILIYIILNILKLEAPPQPIVGLFLAEKNVALIFTSSIIAAIFGPVIEEIFFRGVMYNAVKEKLGIFGAIFITSVLFSFLHTHAPSYFLVGFVPITILGAVLAYLYEKTGSLIPSITLHILNNIGGIIMVFLFKYFNNLV